MPYHADRTGQITLSNGRAPAEKVHETEAGRPLCNTAIRQLRGEPAVFTEQGPGCVTCLRCEVSAHRQRRLGLRARMKSC